MMTTARSITAVLVRDLDELLLALSILDKFAIPIPRHLTSAIHEFRKLILTRKREGTV